MPKDYQSSQVATKSRIDPGIDFESKDLPVKKAGFFIYGYATVNGKRQLYVVAPYSEGRFGDGIKHFSLPKGSVDKLQEEDPKTGKKHHVMRLNPQTGKMEAAYEAPLRAAIRETKEEAGIDIAKLIGPGLMRRLELLGKPNPTAADREEMQNDKNYRVIDSGPGFNSIPYLGVRIKHITAAPIADQICIGRNGKALRTQMFGIELAEGDILNPQLRSECKNPLPEKDGKVDEARRVGKLLESHKLYPTRNRLMAWMVQGTMPEQSWNRNALNDLRRREKYGEHYKPIFPNFTEADTKLPGNEDGKWFCDLLRHHGIEPDGFNEKGVPLRAGGEPLFHRAQWEDFYQHVITPQERAQVDKMVEHIKETVKKIFDGQDASLFKIDTSDVPLNVYQEGADIMPLRDYINKSLDEGKHNMAYRNVFLGGSEANAPMNAGLMYSQLGMTMAIARDADIDKGYIRRHFGSPVLASLEAQRSKFAEQQEHVFKTAIEPDAGAALQRSRDHMASLRPWAQRTEAGASSDRSLG